MLIYLSILPFYLLIALSVTSADLIKNKRVPRRNIQFTRTYNFNHPPVVATPDQIPVTVIYEDDEDIKARNIEKMAVIFKNKVINSAGSRKTINHEVRSRNHPPFEDMFPFAMAKDYEEDIYMKPRARSIKLPATESYETQAPEITSADLTERAGNKTRRRSSHVRKMKVNKSQFDVYVNETEISEDKVTQKELKSKTEDMVNEKSITFKRRKQLREPVVPIVDSENYVYSHSGNYHYSYEGGDGTKAYERGELRNSNGGAGNAVEGNFSYKDKDGNDYSLTYTADENGYRPIGDHLPTPPPIPPAIQRALAYLATKTTPEPITERSRWI